MRKIVTNIKYGYIGKTGLPFGRPVFYEKMDCCLTGLFFIKNGLGKETIACHIDSK